MPVYSANHYRAILDMVYRSVSNGRIPWHIDIDDWLDSEQHKIMFFSLLDRFSGKFSPAEQRLASCWADTISVLLTTLGFPLFQKLSTKAQKNPQTSKFSAKNLGRMPGAFIVRTDSRYSKIRGVLSGRQNRFLMEFRSSPDLQER